MVKDNAIEGMILAVTRDSPDSDLITVALKRRNIDYLEEESTWATAPRLELQAR